MACTSSPRPGASQHHRGVGEAADLDLGLPGTDRFEDDVVEAGDVEGVEHRGDGEGQPAEMAPGGDRADEDAGVGGVLAHAGPVTEDRPARQGARRVDGQHRHRAVAAIPQLLRRRR